MLEKLRVLHLNMQAARRLYLPQSSRRRFFSTLYRASLLLLHILAVPGPPIVSIDRLLENNERLKCLAWFLSLGRVSLFFLFVSFSFWVEAQRAPQGVVCV